MNKPLKAYRAVLRSPPPEGYLIATTVSSWRRNQETAQEARQAFFIAANRDPHLIIEIEEALTSFFSVAWTDDHHPMVTHETDLLLPVASDARFQDAKFAIIEALGHSDVTVTSIATKKYSACQLNRLRKQTR